MRETRMMGLPSDLLFVHRLADECPFVAEMVERLRAVLFHDLRTLDLETRLVDRIRYSGDLRRGRPDSLDVEVSATAEFSKLPTSTYIQGSTTILFFDVVNTRFRDERGFFRIARGYTDPSLVFI